MQLRRAAPAKTHRVTLFGSRRATGKISREKGVSAGFVLENRTAFPSKIAAEESKPTTGNVLHGALRLPFSKT